LAAEAARLLGEVLPYSNGHRPRFKRYNSALVVLDLQRYFLEPESHAFAPAAPAVLPVIRQLISAYRAAGLPIIFTRHLNTPEGAGMMSRWWGELLTEDNLLSELVPELTQPGDVIIEKEQYDAFYETGLTALLQEKGVERLVLCGLLTHLCVASTARGGFQSGFEVYLPVDATATYSRELHRAALLTLTHGCVNPMLSGELLGVLVD
ncbi:cysteine hydrolase, partial [bacterium]|nr:cysteine hydrolase [bacterium]